ncbi:hypothetical protein BJX96DRAFT_16419 [Aspergillus floccosus]
MSQHPLCTQLGHLSLAKFSHTTTSLNHKGPFNWSHIPGDGNMIGIFERITTSPSTAKCLLLKIAHNNHVLEEVDLAYFTREAMTQSQPEQPSQLMPVFAVVVKLPCLAVKYPNATGWVRRFQIKFSQDADYYKALSILSDINCPFTEANSSSKPPSRKPASSQWHLGSIPSIPSFNENLASAQGVNGHVRPVLNNVFPPQPVPTATHTSSVTASSLPPSSSGTIRTAHTDYSAVTSSQPHAGRLPHLDPASWMTNGPNSLNPSELEKRPFTSTTYQDPQTLDNILPPQRDLPFSKPPAKRSCTDIGRPSAFGHAAGEYRAVSSIDIHNNRPNTTTPCTSHDVSQPYRSKPLAKGSKIVTLKYPTHPLPETTSNGQPINANCNSYTPSLNTPPLYLQRPSMANTENNTDGSHARDSASRRERQTAPFILSDLSSYLSAPTRERTIQLEDWICANIEDDGFLQLCQDVESIWRRIALGR